LKSLVFKFGVACCFILGKLSGHTLSQTIVCKAPTS
jgi:hypothetical protein